MVGAAASSPKSGSLEASDFELLQRARDGDHNAFSTLMRRHEQQIFSLAFRMLGNRTDALDATQDTFINVFRRSEAFRGDSAFSTWLYRIGVNACKDLLRKKARAPIPQEFEAEEAPAGSADDVGDRVASNTDLARALSQLPDEYREAVVMFDLGGVPYDEIARVTGTALGTVKSRISRGRRRLAEILEQPDDLPPSKGKT